MQKPKIIEQVNNLITDFMKNNNLGAEIEDNIRTILLGIFSKLNLVTRDEFEIQQKVLISTRKKLDEIEDLINKILEKSGQNE